MTDETKRYQELRKQVAKKRAMRIFFYHLVAYAMGNVFLGAWNIFTYQNRGDQTLWFFSPLIFWGVGVIIHYLQGVALFEDWWEMDDRTTELQLTHAEAEPSIPAETTTAK